MISHTIVHKHRAWIAIVLLLVFPLLPIRSISAGETVYIAVASNFAGTLRSLLASFKPQSPHEFKVSSASTGKLFAQIKHGAPFDIFLAADAQRPGLLVADGHAVAGSLFTYAVGRLVLWRRIATEGTLEKSEILGLTIGRLTIANPKTAPYGKAAEETLRALGLWRTWQPRLVWGENIGQAYQFVASGAVDSGFVALSQIFQGNRMSMGGKDDTRSKGEIRIVPSLLHTPLWQQAVLLNRGTNNAGAKDFMNFLRSRKAHQIIEAEGYEPPDS
uniref:Molybdate transport system substrate-binding protein n=1 Tax=Candidatus Kentrum sp. LFY TaxID=2126342 RepID=A0A450UK40_9GAMM|nr:MAG: molybdate transport system substrate-binding protein [Candidatus Kentron sp. LFY]